MQQGSCTIARRLAPMRATRKPWECARLHRAATVAHRASGDRRATFATHCAAICYEDVFQPAVSRFFRRPCSTILVAIPLLRAPPRCVASRGCRLVKTSRATSISTRRPMAVATVLALTARVSCRRQYGEEHRDDAAIEFGSRPRRITRRRMNFGGRDDRENKFKKSCRRGLFLARIRAGHTRG